MKSGRIAIQKALIQGETQIVFQLGVKARDFYEKGKGNNYMNKRKKFILVLISQGRTSYRCR